MGASLKWGPAVRIHVVAFSGSRRVVVAQPATRPRIAPRPARDPPAIRARPTPRPIRDQPATHPRPARDPPRDPSRDPPRFRPLTLIRKCGVQRVIFGGITLSTHWLGPPGIDTPCLDSQIRFPAALFASMSRLSHMAALARRYPGRAAGGLRCDG